MTKKKNTLSYCLFFDITSGKYRYGLGFRKLQQLCKIIVISNNFYQPFENWKFTISKYAQKCWKKRKVEIEQK